ncbi:MAG: hypothetical protein J6Z40_12060, partial [Oscillospiraceae bacterium]|nr:hypothetical protein [Oscillospiraceae bacterium]
ASERTLHPAAASAGNPEYSKQDADFSSASLFAMYDGIPKGQCPFGRVQHEETSFFMFGGAHY